MRVLVLIVALSTTLPALYACTTANPKSRTYQTMTNTPNTCGVAFKRNREAC